MEPSYNTSNYSLSLSNRHIEKFLNSISCNNFLQSLEMFNRYQKSGQEAYYVAMRDRKSRIVASALIVETRNFYGKKVFSIPGGPILNYDSHICAEVLTSFIQLLKEFLASKHGSVLEISPYIPYSAKVTKILRTARFKELGEFEQCKWISVLDLSNIESPEALFRTFRKGHRYSIKYTRDRFHLGVRELKRNELVIFKNLSDKSAEKHSFRDRPLSYYQEMFDAFGDKVKFLAAFYEGIPISSAMFVIYGKEIVYLYCGNDPAYNHVAGSYALQWKMINYALGNHIPRYNFYGTHPEPGDGVYEFKAGFRAEAEELQGTFACPIDTIGELYVRRKKYHKYNSMV